MFPLLPKQFAGKILIVRRDNIGDLICTTPLIAAIRQFFPQARIDALVNSYNAPILVGNPDLDHVYVYTKGKHREPGETALGAHWRRLRMLWALRRQHYDLAIFAGNAQRARPLARWLAPGANIALGANGLGVGTAIGICPDGKVRHEVERTFRLLEPLAIAGPPPALCLRAAEMQRQRVLAALQAQPGCRLGGETIAIHISARKIPQRWPAERFAALMQRLHAERGCQFVLLWSPGDENNPRHPGDDRKAATILAACAGLPVLPYASERLEQLIGALSICSSMICSDGGAMHIGAALGLPIVCFFGNSDPAMWHPWGVHHIVLQKPSKNVDDISVDEAAIAFFTLMA